MNELGPKKRLEAKLKVLKRERGEISQTTKDLPKSTESVENKLLNLIQKFGIGRTLLIFEKDLTNVSKKEIDSLNKFDPQNNDDHRDFLLSLLFDLKKSVHMISCRDCQKPMKQYPYDMLVWSCKKCKLKAELTYKDMPVVKLKEDNRSVFEMIGDVAKSIPDSEWDKLPRNGSEIVGNESEYLAMCPECNFAMKYDSEKKTYLCSNCDKEYKLVEK